jgi:hypothetical protein
MCNGKCCPKDTPKCDDYGNCCSEDNLLVTSDGGKVCCPSKNICGNTCCPSGKDGDIITCDTTNNKCVIRCGQDKCDINTSYCFNDDTINKKYCLSKDCEFGTVTYDPPDLKSYPVFQNQNGKYFCKPSDQVDSTLKRTATSEEKSDNMCKSTDCVGRLREYGTISEKIQSSKSNNKILCSSFFNPNTLTDCSDIIDVTTTNLKNEQFCRDSNGKLTGRFCEHSACVNGECVVYNCDNISPLGCKESKNPNDKFRSNSFFTSNCDEKCKQSQRYIYDAKCTNVNKNGSDWIVNLSDVPPENKEVPKDWCMPDGYYIGKITGYRGIKSDGSYKGGKPTLDNKLLNKTNMDDFKKNIIQRNNFRAIYYELLDDHNPVLCCTKDAEGRPRIDIELDENNGTAYLKCVSSATSSTDFFRCDTGSNSPICSDNVGYDMIDVNWPGCKRNVNQNCSLTDAEMSEGRKLVCNNK